MRQTDSQDRLKGTIDKNEKGAILLDLTFCVLIVLIHVIFAHRDLGLGITKFFIFEAFRWLKVLKLIFNTYLHLHSEKGP